MVGKRAYFMAMGLLMAAVLVSGQTQAQAENGFKSGDVELKSAGPITFGPKGVLFVSDPKAASVYAIATKDAAGDPAKVSVNVAKITDKIAALLGTTADKIRVNDMAANQASANVYLSVSRGASVVIMRVDAAGKLSEVSLKGVSFAKAELPNPPEDKIVGSGRRKANNRMFSMTDIAFIDGRLVVAGLSNEEFASNLRAIPFPFSKVNRGSSVEIFHGSHGRLETRSPVRAFVPISINGSAQIIAAYTCTPLVRIPLSELKPGVKVTGTTIAELGNRNRPLDMIAYKKDGKQFILMANNARGIMKISTDKIVSRDGITKKTTGIVGQPYDTIKALTGVTQLDRLNDASAVILVEADGAAELKTVALP
jgi:hypothetical protein